MKKFKILALLAVMAILWTIPVMAFAQEVPPAIVIGKATNNGVPVATGTTVSALVDGADVGSAKTSADGKFTVTAKGVKGDTLTFKIGDGAANETAKLADNGEILKMDLSVKIPINPEPMMTMLLLLSSSLFLVVVGILSSGIQSICRW